MTWGQNRRLDFIRQHVGLYGSIINADICKRFACTRTTALNDLKAFREKFPDELIYLPRLKRFEAGPRFVRPDSFELAGDPVSDQASDVAVLQARISTLEAQLNTPETRDFVEGVMREAAHQRERWGSEHDAGKAPLDWFWLIGYLAQKAATAAIAGDQDKARHHTISTAAAMANWHRALLGLDDRMRPGIEPPAEVA